MASTITERPEELLHRRGEELRHLGSHVEGLVGVEIKQLTEN